MVSCPRFCHALKQLPALQQMGNLSFWWYFMTSAHIGNGLQQLEIHLIFDDPSLMLASWRDEPYPSFPRIVQMHASCLQKNHDPDPKPLLVWMQIMKCQSDGWRLKASWLSTVMRHSFFWSPCREDNSVVSPPEFRSGLLPGEISLVCGFVYADLSITCFLGWELFAQT